MELEAGIEHALRALGTANDMLHEGVTPGCECESCEIHRFIAMEISFAAQLLTNLLAQPEGHTLDDALEHADQMSFLACALPEGES